MAFARWIKVRIRRDILAGDMKLLPRLFDEQLQPCDPVSCTLRLLPRAAGSFDEVLEAFRCFSHGLWALRLADALNDGLQSTTKSIGSYRDSEDSFLDLISITDELNDKLDDIDEEEDYDPVEG